MNLEFVESETLWRVSDSQNARSLLLGEHAAPLLLCAVLLVTVQLDLQLEGPRTVWASLSEKKGGETKVVQENSSLEKEKYNTKVILVFTHPRKCVSHLGGEILGGETPSSSSMVTTTCKHKTLLTRFLVANLS